MTAPLADIRPTASSPTAYTDLGGLSALKRDAKDQSPEAVRKVAQQFESIFAKMVLSSMRQATFGDSLFGSDQQQFYQGMFDDQLAVELTKGKGLGLADMLVQQLTRAGLIKSDAASGPHEAGVSQSGAAGRVSQIGTPGASGRASETGAPHAAGMGSQSGTPGAAVGAGKNNVRSTGASAGAGMNRDLLFNTANGAERASPARPFWQAGSPEEFVQQLWPCAQEAGKALGVDPKHLLAQAALETGWGRSLPCDIDGTPSFNFFGIKAGGSWQGDSVHAKTLEFEGGVPIPQKARFRAYDSPAESFRDYVEVLRNNPRYADALNTGSNAKAFANALQRGGYATDPRYAMKIETIVQNLPISETALKSATQAPMTSPTDVF